MHPLLGGVAEGSRRFGPWRVEPLPFDTGDSFAEYLISLGVDGCILTFDAPREVRLLRKARLPVVLAATPPVPDLDVPTVVPDDVAIGTLAAQHLFDCGYRRFAFFGCRERWSLDRFRGFSAEVHRLAPQFTLLTNAKPGTVDAFPALGEAAEPARLRAFIRSLPHRTAVLAANDALARRLVDDAVEAALRVPGDLAILGVDNDPLCCETGTLPLSSVNPNLHRIGFLAALTLDRLLRGEKPESPLIHVPPLQVVRRQSTSLFAHDDPDIAAALRFLHDHACSDITVADVCRHIALSRRSFEQRFRAAVGRSPADEIRHLRIDRAKSLLTETDLSLHEITRRCGYRHLPALAAAFRRLTGTSPAAYRKSHSA